MSAIVPVTVRFVGGPYDGTCAATDDPESFGATLARLASLLTEAGVRIGAAVHFPSPAARRALFGVKDGCSQADGGSFQSPRYTLRAAMQGDSCVHLLMAYAPIGSTS